MLPFDNSIILYKLDKDKFPIPTNEYRLIIIFNKGCDLPCIGDRKPKRYIKSMRQFIKLYYN